MSGSGNLVLIRGGHPSYHQDPWASFSLSRELVWGPDDFESWVMQRPAGDRWDHQATGAVVVDYDQRKIYWSAALEDIWIPRVAELHQRLVKAAWPGYEVQYVSGAQQWREMALAAGAKSKRIEESIREEYRVKSVPEAAGSYDEEFDDDELYDEEESGDHLRRFLAAPPEDLETEPPEEEEEPFEFGPDQARAWVTLIDEEGSPRHRHLLQIPLDLIEAKPGVIQQLMACPPAEIPPEKVVKEGVWIDIPGRVIGFWGGGDLPTLMETVRQQWSDWRIEWANDGYLRHAAACDTPGRPMEEIEALGYLLPRMLSTKRMDLDSMAGHFGRGVKGFAMKATGCLLMVICLPLLIFGAVSGQWRAVGITVLITALLVAIVFKVVEIRIRRWYRSNVPDEAAPDPAEDPAAGPLDQPARRHRLDRLLLVAGFPPLEEIEPRFVIDEI